MAYDLAVGRGGSGAALGDLPQSEKADPDELWKILVLAPLETR